jgi:hypothetical protein
MDRFISRVVHRCVDSDGVIAAEVIDQPRIERAWAHIRWKLGPSGVITGTGGTTLRGAQRVIELKAWAECAARELEPIRGRLHWRIVDVELFGRRSTRTNH